MTKLRIAQTPKPFHVIGFDPGGTTGWARAIFKPTDEMVADPSTIQMDDIFMECGEFTGEHHEELYNYMQFRILDSLIPPEFVSEPFTFRQFARQEGDDIGRGKVELISCEYIGIMKLVAQETQSSLYTGFNSSDAKSWCPNRKLDKIGWLQKPITPKRHMNDALRQVVKYLVVKKLVRHPITSCWKDEDDEV